MTKEFDEIIEFKEEFRDFAREVCRFMDSAELLLKSQNQKEKPTVIPESMDDIEIKNNIKDEEIEIYLNPEEIEFIKRLLLRSRLFANRLNFPGKNSLSSDEFKKFESDLEKLEILEKKFSQRSLS